MLYRNGVIIVNKTIDYYNMNAKNYFKQTVDAKMQENQNRFLSYLKPNSTILDFGCGSGRDIKYFMECGHDVSGIDGSIQLCQLAKEYTHCINIECINFLDYEMKDMYDGIWACASLLHLNNNELIITIKKMIDACKHRGVIYMSFKYGDFEGIRDQRYYIDMNEQRINHLINNYKELHIEDIWTSKDVLKSRGEQIWMNIIVKKL